MTSPREVKLMKLAVYECESCGLTYATDDSVDEPACPICAETNAAYLGIVEGELKE